MWIYKYDSVKTLPDTYQQVEYIQSSWTQYINTWFITTPNTKVELDFQFTSLVQSACSFWNTGSWTSNTWATFCWYLWDSAAHFKLWIADWTGAADVWNNTVMNCDPNRYIFVAENWKATIYNIAWVVQATKNTVRTISQNCKYSSFLFAAVDEDTGVVSGQCSWKLYLCKIYNGWILTREFVPCYRKSDWVIWLYDLVRDVFYTNAWTWTFTTSETLPNTYQKVEWIWWTGTQYINTWYSPSINTKIETEISWWTSQVDWAVFFGMTSSDSAPTWIIWRLYYTSSQWSTTWFNPWFCNALYWETVKVLACDVFHSITMEKNLATADWEYLPITSTGTPYSWNIFLFCWNSGWSAWRYWNCKFKKFKIYNNWTIVRNFIPCYRISDSVIWMYDSINWRFYTNAWSWTFTKWNNVS